MIAMIDMGSKKDYFASLFHLVRVAAHRLFAKEPASRDHLSILWLSSRMMTTLFRCTASPLLILLFGPVFVNAQPAYAGPDASICGSSYTMQGSPVPLGGVGSWSLVLGCGTSTNGNDPFQQVVDLCLGTSVWEWTVNDNGTITTDLVGVTVWDQNFPNANAGDDQTIIWPMNTALLSASPASAGPAVCWWTIESGSALLKNTGDPITTVVQMSLGNQVFCWNCINGPCGETSDCVSVNVVLSAGMTALANDPSTSFTWDQDTGFLTFTGKGLLTDLLVMDTQGRTIMAQSGHFSERSWSMSGLADGVMLVRATMNGRPKVHRFIVQ